MLTEKEFDFTITPEGELVIDDKTKDIKKSMNNQLKIQLAYNRIKSVTHDWFVDHVGANLEELIGKRVDKAIIQLGKNKIKEVLFFDNLWYDNEVEIVAEIISNTELKFTIYLKIVEKNEVEHATLECYLDLVYGVRIRFGWEPRRDLSWFSY